MAEEKALFTCVMHDGEIVSIETRNERTADTKTNEAAHLIIRGTIDNIGAENVKNILGKEANEVEARLEQEVDCDLIVVCDLVGGHNTSIKDAAYECVVDINEYYFCGSTRMAPFSGFVQRLPFSPESGMRSLHSNFSGVVSRGDATLFSFLFLLGRNWTDEPLPYFDISIFRIMGVLIKNSPR